MIRSAQRILDQKIGANLLGARHAASLSVDVVADAMDLPASDVLAFESGQRRPNARQLAAIAKILQVEIHTIFGDTAQTESRTGELSIDRRDLYANLMMQGRESSKLKNLVAAMQNQAEGAKLQERAA
mgnify:CR=1 FL=1